MIPVNEPLLDGNELKYLQECIETGWVSSDGLFVSRFEKAFATRVNRKHAIAVTNGTAALDVTIEALDITTGDEVIVPSFTIISCVMQIIRNGAKPIFIDADPITWNMDVGLVEQKITSRTKAIMAVHIYGLPVDVDPLLKLAKEHNIHVIEDAAEMLGQTYKGQPCGSFGDISTFSFYANKHITTGEGGMVVTDDDDLAERVKSLRNLCFQPDKRFIHDRLGWNLRLTNLQAAVGLAQLERLDEFVCRKRRMGDAYQKYLSGIEEIQLPLQTTEYADNIYWVFGILLNEKSNTLAEAVRKQLKRVGIGTRPFFYPLNRQPVIQKLGLGLDTNACPVADSLYQRGLYLPSGLALEEQQIEQVATNLRSLF